MAKTFTFTEKILQGLNETLMNLNLPNKLDTGLDKSPVASNLSSVVKQNWTKSILGQTSDPGEIRTYTSRYKRVDYGAKFFNPVRGRPVKLLEILTEAGAAPVSEEAYNIPSANYIFMIENNGMYSLGGDYYQMFGDSQSVCIDYKGVKAAVVDGGKYGEYLCNHVNAKYGRATEYIRKIGTASLEQAKQHALSMFTHKHDRDIIADFMKSDTAPGPIYDSVSMGVIDTANIPVKTVRGLNTTGKYLVAPYFTNKDVVIYDQNKVAGTLDNFSPLPQMVKTDIATKISEFTSGSNPYGTNTTKLSMALDLQRRNPVRSYCTILKGCITATNWIIWDMRKVMGTGSSGDSVLFFSNPPIETVVQTVGIPATDSSFQIGFIRAFSNYNGFPLQIRTFTVQYGSNGRYKAKPKGDKLIVVFPGFDAYLRAKEKSDGLSGADGYVEKLKELHASEASSFKASGEDPDSFFNVINRLYLPEGFNEGPLFKWLPPILLSDYGKSFKILTSFEDFSKVELPYYKSLPEVYRTHSMITNGIFPTRADIAANIQFNPMDKDGSFDPSASHLDPDIFSEVSIARQNAIASRFIPLSEIYAKLSAKMDTVTGHDGLIEVGDEFAKVLNNLANGFWSISGGDSEVSKKLSRSGKQLLGFYNLLGSSYSSLGTIDSVINLASLESFRVYQNKALEEADKTIDTRVGKAPQQRG